MLTAIDQNATLKPGDKVLIELVPRVSLPERLNAYILASKIAAMEKKGYDVTRWKYRDDGGIDIEAVILPKTEPQVVQAGVITPAVIIAAIVGITAILFSTSAYLIVDEIADSPELQTVAKTAVWTFPAAAAILAGAVIIWMLKK